MSDKPKDHPDYVYDADNWETTYPWDDRSILEDDMWARSTEVLEVGTLIDGPTMWIVSVPVSFDEDGNPDETEVQWFDTKEAAEAAVSKKGK